MLECEIGRVYNWNSVGLEVVGLEGCSIKSVGFEGCRIGRVKDWKSVGLVECRIGRV